MKPNYYVLAMVGLLLFNCNEKKNKVMGKQQLDAALAKGDFQIILDNIDSSKAKDSIDAYAYDYYRGQIHLIKRDFSIPQAEMLKQMQKVYADATIADLEKWETEKLLEARTIDGEKMYFNRSYGNFKRLSKGYKKEFQGDAVPGKAPEILRRIINGEGLFSSIKYDYTMTIPAGTVPAGEVIRCWMPYPREDVKRQTRVKLLSASQEDYMIAPDDYEQRSIYMEQKAEAGKETKFSYRAEYHQMPEYFDISKAEPYDTNTAFYKEHTAERSPHLVFSPRIQKLAKQIVGDATHPAEIVKRIYYYLNTNIPWAGALEYGTIPNIPEYVLDIRHGDCGQQTLTFMVLARCSGIPTRWQSGWHFPEGEYVNALPSYYRVKGRLHDWCEVYYEGIGWVPLDMSFGLQNSDNEKIKDFYISGMEPYRLIVNNDYGRELYPKKNFPRTEPVDFQRGEVEWRRGTLYFGQWSYKMEGIREEGMILDMQDLVED